MEQKITACKYLTQIRGGTGRCFLVGEKKGKRYRPAGIKGREVLLVEVVVRDSTGGTT